MKALRQLAATETALQTNSDQISVSTKIILTSADLSLKHLEELNQVSRIKPRRAKKFLPCSWIDKLL